MDGMLPSSSVCGGGAPSAGSPTTAPKDDTSKRPLAVRSRCPLDASAAPGDDGGDTTTEAAAPPSVEAATTDADGRALRARGSTFVRARCSTLTDGRFRAAEREEDGEDKAKADEAASVGAWPLPNVGGDAGDLAFTAVSRPPPSPPALRLDRRVIAMGRPAAAASRGGAAWKWNCEKKALVSAAAVAPEMSILVVALVKNFACFPYPPGLPSLGLLLRADSQTSRLAD